MRESFQKAPGKVLDLQNSTFREKSPGPSGYTEVCFIDAMLLACFSAGGDGLTLKSTLISELQDGLLIILIEVEEAPVPGAITFRAAHIETSFLP